MIARERANRPSEFASRPVRRRIDQCPFCAGNEQATPEAIAVYPNHIRPGRDESECGKPHQPTAKIADLPHIATWQVRVIPNKYPAVIDCPTDVISADPLQTSQRGAGIHEIIIESPNHTASFSELTAEQAHWSLAAYRDRLRCLSEHPRLRYGLVFKNCGGEGGATLEHTHSQLIATSHLPANIEHELQASAEYHSRHAECIFCDMVRREVALGERIVATSDRFVAFCPFASRFGYETWILPRSHEAQFALAKLGDLAELSDLLQRIIRGLEKIIPQAPYNYWIHTSPFDSTYHDHYHWHIEFIPRISTQGGFEWGAGCFINSLAPEDAAIALRDACDASDQSAPNP